MSSTEPATAGSPTLEAAQQGAVPAAALATDRRNTVVLVGFTAITNLSDGVLKVALPLIATTLTDSPALVSGVFVTLLLPWILAALHVGVLVDRVDRRALLWLANTVRMAMLGILLAATALGWLGLPLIYGCGLVLGLAEVVALTSAAALIPVAVSPVHRERANSWLTAAETVCSEFIGPFLGGLLVAASAMIALGWTAGGYAATTLALLFLAGRFRPRVDPDKPRPSVNAQIGEALRFLWQQRVLRVMTLLVAALCSLWGAWLGLMPLYATREMGLSPANYGLLLGMLGIGGTVGSLLVGRANRLFGRRRVMLANTFLTGAMVAFPAATTNIWLVGFGALLGGLGGGLWVVNARTVSQTLVEAEMMGRYNAVARLFGWGASPVGAAIAGLIAEGFGARAAFAVFTGVALLVVVPFRRDFPPATAADIEARLTAARGGAEPSAGSAA